MAVAMTVVIVALHAATPVDAGQPPLPELTAPINDFADVIDPASERELDRLSRSLQSTTGDVTVIVTVASIEGYADIREYAVKLFENRGRGIGERGKDNGLLILLAVKERRVQIEVGYGLEPWITDGFAGETIREEMLPEFRRGQYGAGLLAGTRRLVGRIAERRNVTLTGVEAPRTRTRARSRDSGLALPLIGLIVLALILMSRKTRRPRRGRRHWGHGGWSGWSSGVGPFGGGFGGFGGGGFGGGGFGGGFGGFGGGRSGGGGAGGSW
jgi:uncharacterized protein